MPRKIKDLEFEFTDKDAGHFGRWFIDEYGLPAYEYTCNQITDPIAKTPTTGKPSVDHFHQLGNDRLNITAHNDGRLQIFTGDRGFQWISYLNMHKNCLGGGLLFISENNNTWIDIFTKDISDSSKFRRIFGAGYFKKIISKKGLSIKHKIIPSFGDESIILSEIEIKNELDKPRKLKIGYYYGIRIKYLVGSLLSNLYMTKNRRNFGNKIISLVGKVLKTLILFIGQGGEQIRERFASKFSYQSKYLRNQNSLILSPIYKNRIKKKPEQSADRNYFPKSVFLSDLSEKEIDNYYNGIKIKKKGKSNFYFKKSYQDLVKSDWGRCLLLEKEIKLEPGENIKLKYIFGYLRENKIAEKIQEIKNNQEYTNSEIQLKKWNNELIKFRMVEYSWLEREISWHSYYLLSTFLYDEYFRAHYITQGNAYTYLHGLNGAIRDFILFNYPLIFINPEKAKEFLIYILRTMKPNGELPYAITGFGQIEGAMVHESSSDLGLFLLWGLSDYIFLTQDLNFLDEVVQFYPLDSKDSNKKSSVYDRIILTINFLLNEIGFGKHKMVRVGSGDWSDGISMFVSNRKKFLENGESTFNSAFFLYLIPRIIPLLKEKDKELKERLEKIYEKLKDAINNTWNGKWYYRAWNSDDPIGDSNIFLEHHPWIILSNAFPKKNIDILIRNIHEILDIKSKIGQYVCYPPNKTLLNIIRDGWAENGGIWYAMNFLMTWAYTKCDPKKAFNSFIKNSMANRAKIYPKIWYGIWSGSDSYNAEYAKNPGHTFIHPLTPQIDFPIMNMNIHANFLNSLLKLSGIDAKYNEIVIDPKFPSDFSLKTNLLDIQFEKDNLNLDYKIVKGNKMNFTIKLTKEMGNNLSININNKKFERFKIQDNYLILKDIVIKNNKINIRISKI